MIKKITFDSKGKTLIGHLFLPADYDETKKYTGVIVSGSWTTVKEQMAGAYAKRFSEKGFVALAYDPRGYGESEGDIMYYENPEMKIEDIKSAVDFMTSLDTINKIGAFGVCAGAGYTLVAASEDERIAVVATAASWIHDEEAVKLFYGGEEGVRTRIESSKAAEIKYKKSGEVEYIQAISTTDETAAMFGPYDYYLNSDRGAIPEWKNDRFAVMTWEAWLTFNPRPSAKN